MTKKMKNKKVDPNGWIISVDNLLCSVSIKQRSFTLTNTTQQS